MALWSRIYNWFGGNATRVQHGEQDQAPSSYFTPAPMTVTEDTALQLSTVWACTKLLAENVSTLPINVYRKSADGRELDNKQSLYTLLNRRPNSRMTAVEFRETMMLNLVLHGNAYARIERNARGDVIALWPMPAMQMTVNVLMDGTLIYTYRVDNNVAVLSAENVLHVKIFGNGITGLSPLANARSTMGIGMATEDYVSSFYRNGGKPSGVLTMDEILKPEQRTQIRQLFSDTYEGSGNAHKLMLLEAGMKYQQVQINPEDMQMMEARKFQVEDIARFMGVPSVLINSPNTTAWGSGIEQIMLGFYNLNLRPYLDRWEQAIERALLTANQRGKIEVEFDFEKLLRGDMNTRASYFSTLTQNGLMTRNEGRQKLNLPPMDGGDELTAQINLAPVGTLGEQSNAPDEINQD